jgi:hypothetical protein
MQRRAKCNGLIYMLATLALAAYMGFALVSAEFWNPILALFEGDLMANLTANTIGVVCAVLDCILALVLVINAIKTFTKLGWLFKKKASKVHGFNRNMYAMDDLGKIFTSTFASIVWIRFFEGMIAGGYAIADPFEYIVLAAGVFVHFFCGLIGGNVSVFSNENGVEEIKREIGNFVPFIRNLLQIAITGALMVFAMDHAPAVKNTVEGLVADPAGALNNLGGIVMLVGALFIVMMIGRALNNVEFDPEGPEAGGRGAFVALSVFAFLVFAAAFAAFQVDSLLLAGIALAGIVIDGLTVKYPREVEVNYDEVDANKFFNQNYLDPSVYVMPNMVQHPVQQEFIQPYAAYGFELDYGMKKPAKLNKKR